MFFSGKVRYIFAEPTQVVTVYTLPVLVTPFQKTIVLRYSKV